MNSIWFRPAGEWLESGDEIYDVSTGVFSLKICSDQLRRVEDPALQRQIFKKFVKRIVIETSSYCNRRCVFCPNSDGSRLGERRLMPQEVFESVIGDLCEIEYDGAVLFHLYNEPLANPAIFDQVAHVRQQLPNARLSFNSNGDYVRPGTLGKLAESGLNNLHISIYGPGHGVFNRDYVQERVEDMAEACGFDRKSTRWVNEIECRAAGVFVTGSAKLQINIQAKDFNIAGYDRGGLVDIDGQLFQRTTPCPSPFDEVLLTWDGTAVPCCNIVGDKPEHRPFTVGSLRRAGSVFEIYANGPQVEWRRNLLRFDNHRGPCSQCTRLSSSSQLLGDEQIAFNAAADRLLNATRKAAANRSA